MMNLKFVIQSFIHFFLILFIDSETALSAKCQLHFQQKKPPGSAGRFFC